MSAQSSGHVCDVGVDAQTGKVPEKQKRSPIQIDVAAESPLRGVRCVTKTGSSDGFAIAVFTADP